MVESAGPAVRALLILSELNQEIKTMSEKLNGDARMDAAVALVGMPGALMPARIKQTWRIECLDKHGRQKWVEVFDNLVVDVGLNEYLERIYKSSGFTASDFVGIKATGAIVAGDTMAAHGGWSELTIYSNGTRPAFTPGAVASESVDNSASKAVFNINAGGTVTGAFISDDNTKGGSTGILLGGGEFASSRTVANGDTLNVTMTASLTSS